MQVIPTERTWSLQGCWFEEQEILRWLEACSEVVVAFPAVSATLVSISLSLQFCTGQGEVCEVEHKETQDRRHPQKTVPA